LGHNYGTLSFLYELNSQSSDRHLTVAELRSIGAAFVRCAGSFLSSPDGQTALSEIDARRRDRLSRWAVYKGPPDPQNAISTEAGRFGQSDLVQSSSETVVP
jgi:hypothetical protein